MANIFNQQQVNDLLRGSSFFSTGGGVTMEIQQQLFTTLYNQGHQFVLQNISELADTDYVCTCYVVGSTRQTGVDLSTQIQQGAKILQKLVGSTFSAIFAGEINVEALAFQSSALLNVPILDADCCGGRAVPEIQMDNVVISGRKITPLVAVNQQGKTLIIRSEVTGEKIERKIRQFADKSQGSVAVLDHPMTVSEAKLCLELGTLSRSQKIGRFIQKKRHQRGFLASLCKLLNAQLFIKGTIQQIHLSEHTGFLIGTYEVHDVKGNIMRIFVKNENIIGWINNEVVLTGPDLLVTFGLQTGLGVHNGSLKNGQKVAVFGVPASKAWRTDAGIQTFHPKHFGFDFDPFLLP